LSTENASLVSAKKYVKITSDPKVIEQEVRKMAALAISTLFFGQQMSGSVRNFNRVRYGERST
jgi:hypothetical protein